MITCPLTMSSKKPATVEGEESKKESQWIDHSGGCGVYGRLTKEQERELKAYTTKLHLFEDPRILQESMLTVRALVGISDDINVTEEGCRC